MISRRLKKAFSPFRLIRYEGQPARKLYLIFSVTLALVAFGVMEFGRATGSSRIVISSNFSLAALLAYGFFVITMFDNFLFLLYVEKVFKSLLCLVVIMLARLLLFASYGPVNNFEFALAALFSVFGRAQVFDWLKSWEEPLGRIAADIITRAAHRGGAPDSHKPSSTEG